jgi:hypothetical protein
MVIRLLMTGSSHRRFGHSVVAARFVNGLLDSVCPLDVFLADFLETPPGPQLGVGDTIAGERPCPAQRATRACGLRDALGRGAAAGNGAKR